MLAIYEASVDLVRVPGQFLWLGVNSVVDASELDFLRMAESASARWSYLVIDDEGAARTRALLRIRASGRGREVDYGFHAELTDELAQAISETPQLQPQGQIVALFTSGDSFARTMEAFSRGARAGVAAASENADYLGTFGVEADLLEVIRSS